MDLELETNLPAQASVQIQFTMSARVNVTAQSAQRQVTKLLLDQVGNLLYGEKPNLVVGEKLLWRIPVWLSLPTTGPLGQVGTIDVDAETGEIHFSPQLLTDLTERGNALAQRATSATRLNPAVNKRGTDETSFYISW